MKNDGKEPFLATTEDDKAVRLAFLEQYNADKRFVAKPPKEGYVDCIGVDKKTGEAFIHIGGALPSHVPKDTKTTRYVVSGTPEFDEIKNKA